MTIFCECHLRDDALSSLHRFLYGEKIDDLTDGFAIPTRNLLAQISFSSNDQIIASEDRTYNFFTVSFFAPIVNDENTYFGIKNFGPLILFALAVLLFETTVASYSIYVAIDAIFEIASFLVGALLFCIFGNICSILLDIYYEKKLRYRSITCAPLIKAIYDHETPVEKSDYYQFNFGLQLWNAQTIRLSIFWHMRAIDYISTFICQFFRNGLNLFAVSALTYLTSDAIFDGAFSAQTAPLLIALICFGAADLFSPDRNLIELIQRTFFQTIICILMAILFLQQTPFEENSKNFNFLMRWFLWCSICRASLIFHSRLQY